MSTPKPLTPDEMRSVLAPKGILPTPELVAEPGRALCVEDLGLIASTPVGSTTPPLKRIRAQHHQAARLLANGARPGEVSALTGFSPSRISVLQADPAFAELVAHYTAVEAATYADVQERMVMLGLSAGEEILDRLESDPEMLSVRELTDILKASLDRGGHAPVAKSENKSVSLVLGPEDLAAMKQSQADGGTIIDKAAIYASDTQDSAPAARPLPEALPEDHSSPMGETFTNLTLGAEIPPPPRLPRKGSGV